MHTSPTSRRDIGNTWEDIACKYLESRGYTIIERNWQIKGGEIDIIAAKDGHYHCIEVRYRKNERFGHPLDTLTAKKRFTLKRSLFLYMYTKNIDPEFIQVDFLGIMPQGDGHRVWYIPNISLE